MPKLLVSVRDAREAEAALAGGADWIDLKEPKLGPLGAVDAGTAHEAVRIATNVPLSAAAGELADWPQAASRGLLQVAGISYFKLGLAGCRGTSWQAHWNLAQRQMAAVGAELIAVIYADAVVASSPPLTEILKHAEQSKSPWLLLDTFDKSGGRIIDHLQPAMLRELLSRAGQSGMKRAVAGSLAIADIKHLPLESIDMIAVRGAACHAGRDSSVHEQNVRQLRRALDACESATAGVALD